MTFESSNLFVENIGILQVCLADDRTFIRYCALLGIKLEGAQIG